MLGLELCVMFVMILLNAGFAAFEIALASISIVRLQHLVREGRSGSRAALSMKRSMEGSLAVVQLGITLVGAIAAAVAGAGAQEGISPYLQSEFGLKFNVAQFLSVTFVVLPLTFITIIFGELIPKVFALRNPESVLLKLSPIMKVFAYFSKPVVWCLESSVQKLLELLEKFHKGNSANSASTEANEIQEIKTSATIARTSRLIGHRQEKIISGAAELSQRPVKDIILPAEFISMIHLDSSPGDALVVAHLDMHTRFPVTEVPGDPQKIVGYVMFKDIVASLRFAPNDTSIRSIVRKISSYDGEIPIAQVLERLIRDHAHIALVKDENQQVLGMVTMEDLMEELVGDIEDEYDRLPAQIVATGNGWIVGGGSTLQAIALETQIKIPDTDLLRTRVTLNEWLTEQLESPIKGAEVLETQSARIQIRKSRRHKVMEALITPLTGTVPPVAAKP